MDVTEGSDSVFAMVGHTILGMSQVVDVMNRKVYFAKTEKITQLQRNKYESERINVAFTKTLKRLTN